MTHCEKSIMQCRRNLARSLDSLETIQLSLCGLMGSIRVFVENDRQEEALRTLGKMEGAFVAAWTAVREEKQHEIELLEGIGTLVAVLNSMIDPEMLESIAQSRTVDSSVSSIIRYLDPDADASQSLPGA